MKIYLKDHKTQINILRDEEDIKGIFYYYSFLYFPKIIYSKIISYYHNNLLVSHFEIEKTRKLVYKKYF